MAAPMPASRPPRIPMCQAFSEAVAIVRRGLEQNGIRWGDQAEQDAVCTLLIQAGKNGMLLPWEPPTQKTAPPSSKTDHPATEGTLEDVLGRSILQARQRRNLANFGPQPVTPKPSEDAKAPAAAANPAFSVMIRAFHEVEADLPPEVYSAILEWHHITRPEDFRPDQIKQAAACYVALKSAREQYRADQQTTIEHFEATEDLWR